jgi:hypothetical protein
MMLPFLFLFVMGDVAGEQWRVLLHHAFVCGGCVLRRDKSGGQTGQRFFFRNEHNFVVLLL